VNDFFAMIFYGILAKRTNNPNSFLQNTGDIVSARPARLIKEMARLVQPDEHLGNLLVSDISTPLKISEVRKHPELNRKFTEYLQEFGDRCLEELKLESPTLIDDPGSLLTSIGSFALRFEEEGAETTSASEHQGVGKVPFLQRLLINKTRILLRNRENLRFERTRLFGRVRGIMRELGARLQADQQIEAIDDIFYLTLDEVLETSRTRPLMSLVETRKREFEKYRNDNPPPDRFITRGPLHRYKTFKADQPVSVQSPADLQGIGACPGIVRGPVRVVTDPRQASLKKGEILVASQTDPGWIILFPAASGLLVERGSLLSHSAIVARELNLPCIVSLANITTTLKTGDQIEMDGQSGQVTLLQTDP
jgi:pyruvate,water dikinase